MSINLSKKGDTVSFINLKKTKPTANLNTVYLGMGWDINHYGQDYDLDACAIFLDENNNFTAHDVISYKNQKPQHIPAYSMGDNLTGEGEGDDETIVVKLSELPSKYKRIIFYVTIYQGNSRGQHFGKVQNAHIRLLDSSKNEMVYTNLSKEKLDDKRSYVFAELVNTNGEWNYTVIGDSYKEDDLTKVAEMYKNKTAQNVASFVSNTVEQTVTNTVEQQEKKRKKFFGLF